MHAEWTIRAMEAGLPVLCEKPFTVTAAEARDVIAASKRTGQIVAEAFMYRFHPVYDEVLALIASGAIGRVTSVRSVFSFFLEDRGNIRASAELRGGALMDVGCYCVNFSRRIAGCEPVRASAFERRTTVDDTLMGLLEFPNGILAEFECSIENHSRRTAEIAGTEGAIFLENAWFPGEESARITVRRGDTEEIITTPGANNYRLESEDFVHAVRTHQPLRWGPEDAVANMSAIEALYRSVREGTTADVEQPV